MAAATESSGLLGTRDIPVQSSKLSFLVGFLGVLLGATIVSFSLSPQPNEIHLPMLSHGHKSSIHKEVVDKGNWIEDFAVSRGVMVAGQSRTFYVSGQTAFDGTNLVGDNMGDQLAAAIANVDETLKLAGMAKCDIVKLIVFVTSTDDVLAEWDKYETWLQDCPVKPANTLVAIQSLFRPDALVEIDVTAVQ